MVGTLKNTVILAIASLCLFACGDEDSNDGNNASNANDSTAAEGGAAGTGGPETGSDASEDGESDSDSADSGEAGELTGDEEGWNQTCAESSDCADPVGLCSKAPGQAEGYCSTTCATTADCPYGEDWSCNIIGTCDAPAATWCGPREETVTNAGIVIACD